tara:strand:+ start:728 stop:2926 length:2199 start_codon:yes stop_codon:yes gene_type:complete
MALKIAISPEGKEKIARSMGYKGDMRKFKEFLASDPSKQAQLKKYYKAARGGAIKMLKDGGVIGYASGGLTDSQIQNMSKDQAAAMVDQLGGANIKWDGTNHGDYSNLDSFKTYKGWDNVPGGFDTWKKVAEKAGLGQKNKASSDKNVKSGALEYDSNVYQQTGADAEKAVEKKPDIGKANPLPTYDLTKDMQGKATNPTLTGDMKVTPEKITVEDNQLIDKETGQVTGDQKATATTATKEDDVDVPDTPTVAKTSAVTAEDDVEKELDKLSPEKLDDETKEDATIVAEEEDESSVSDLKATQGKSIVMNNETQRKIEDGELVDSQVDPQKASQYVEEVQAATATPTAKATVKGQLDDLMKDFEGGETPTWAAGAMRAATAKMLSRGLSHSSMAGQAIIQAAMESAMPIAQADASTQASFEAQNLSNRQQVAMHAAQQRAAFMKQDFDQKFQAKVLNASKIADVANMNFTAEQQIALENSRNANTMNLANLNNQQALVMAEAAALSQLDIANLSNRQQAAVQNAQNFLAIDMANLNNAQQTTMFKAQANVQALFNDQAAQNAANQFNASSENQVNQFFAGLKAQVGQFNVAQANAMAQFNTGQTNAMAQFNTNIANQRDQFNAQNELIVAQGNVQWRRAVATGNTANINRANEFNATSLLGISQQAYANLWQQQGDAMELAWQTAENAQDRITQLANTQLQVSGQQAMADAERKSNNISAIGGFITNLLGIF